MLDTFKAIDFRALPNAAHMEFVNSVSVEVNKLKSLANVDAGRRTVEQLNAARDKEDENFQLSQKSDYTAEINAADKERDNLYMSFRKMVDAYRKFPDIAQANSAIKLWELMKLYKINVSMRLDNQTALMDNLLQDLVSKHTEDINHLNLHAVVQGMKQANDRVRDLVASRTDESATRAVGALKASRAESDEAIRNIQLAVTSMAFVFGEEPYVNFVNTYNVLVERYKKQISSSNGKKADKESEESRKSEE